MKNEIAKRYGAVVTQFTQAIAGVQTYAAPLSLSMVTVANMNTTLTGLIADDAVAKAAKTELATRQKTFRDALASGRTFATRSRDVLKPYLGGEYNSLWDEAGFIGSHRVPRPVDKVLPMLLALKAYFTAHPTHEIEALNLTADAAQIAYDKLVTGKNAVNSQKTTWQTALESRDTKADQAREGVRALIKELSIKLDPMDERWASFGLNKPGQLQMPPVPEVPTGSMQNATTYRVKWEKVARGKNYRLWIKVQGVDEAFRLVDSTAELSYTLEALQSGAVFELAVSAANNGGESQLSEALKVTVP